MNRTALALALAASGTVHHLRGELREARLLLERAESVQPTTLVSEITNDLRLQLCSTCYALGDVEAVMRIMEEKLLVGESPAKNDAARRERRPSERRNHQKKRSLEH